MPKLDVLILTGRTIDQGRGKEMGKMSDIYQKDTSQVQIDPVDMKTLGLRRNSIVKVKTDFGNVILRAVKSIRGPHPSMIFIAYGPWASMVSDPETHGSGMPSLKGMKGTLEAAPAEKVLTMEELINQLRMET
ncbi:molybdopterin dinucleotide-binding protein [Candidatus Bathyarchaeota archaeon]|nr:molybdopterin dinucleotide-binding protein [Candidatus Bathyarchaeota archaeon]